MRPSCLTRAVAPAAALVVLAPLTGLASVSAASARPLSLADFTQETGGSVASNDLRGTSAAGLAACAPAPGDEPVPRATEQAGCARYIVVLKNNVRHPAAVAKEHAAEHGVLADLVYRSALKGYAGLMPIDQVGALRKDTRVASVEVDSEATIFEQETPTGIDRIFATQNSQIGIDGHDNRRIDVDIAILDTGIDYGHPDLNLAGRTDCTYGSPFTRQPVNCLDDAGDDGNGHGTHVAGTAAAIDNGEGVVGVAPGARLWAVKVLGDNGSGSLSGIIAGIDWVTAHSDTIEVVNMSLGCHCQSPAMDKAIAKSVRAGVVYTVSAGNSARDAKDTIPANHPDVITVSALADFDGRPGAAGSPTCRTDQDDTLADFSSFGAVVDVAAPGVCILSTWKGGGYNSISGTSMASPHVAGVAALLSSGGNDPSSKTDVDGIRQEIINTGNFDWSDVRPEVCGRSGCIPGDSPDGIQEPLVDVSDEASFAPATVGGPFYVAPKARFTRICTESRRCSFDASKSTGSSAISEYRWNFGDNTGASGITASHTYKRNGVYTVTLTVTDARGLVGRQAMNINVARPNQLAAPRCGAPGDDRCETWVASYDNPNGYGPELYYGVDVSLDGAVSADGKLVFVTGYSWDHSTRSFDIATVAYHAATGQKAWVARYNGPQGYDDVGWYVRVSPDGKRIYVAGQRDTDFIERDVSSSQDGVMLAYDAATGQQLWVRNVGTPECADGFSGLAVTADGSRVVGTAPKCRDFGSGDYRTVAFDATSGAELWDVTYEGLGYEDSPTTLDISPDDRLVFVSGQSSTGPEFDFETVYDYATVAYDTATGQRVWVARDSYEQAWDTDLAEIKAGAEGSRVYLSHARSTVAYDATTGDRLWDTPRYNRAGGAPGFGDRRDFAVSPNDELVYVTGMIDYQDYDTDWSAPPLTDAVTVAYNATTGDEVWIARYKGDGYDGFYGDSGESVAASPDGTTVYVAARVVTADASAIDTAMIAYDATTGQQLSVARYNPAPSGKGYASVRTVLVASDARKVYIAGNVHRVDYTLVDLASYLVLSYDTTDLTTRNR